MCNPDVSSSSTSYTPHTMGACAEVQTKGSGAVQGISESKVESVCIQKLLEETWDGSGKVDARSKSGRSQTGSWETKSKSGGLSAGSAEFTCFFTEWLCSHLTQRCGLRIEHLCSGHRDFPGNFMGLHSHILNVHTRLLVFISLPRSL